MYLSKKKLGVILTFLCLKSKLGGGADTPIGHWRSSSKTGMPTISSGGLLLKNDILMWPGLLKKTRLTSYMHKIHFRPRIRP